MWRYSLLLFLCFCIGSCHTDQPDDDPSQTISTQDINKGLIPSQKMYIKQEKDEINEYVTTHHYPMQTTGTGIHYWIYEHGKGEIPQIGQYVLIDYRISLLDGTVCYDSKQDRPREFCVGKDDVESGVHQAVQMMHLGDKGLFILPSYLAHGVVGDRDKIPPGAVVVYDITLLKIQNTP